MNISKVSFLSFGMPKRNFRIESDFVKTYHGAYRDNPDIVLNTEERLANIERLHEEKFGCCNVGNASFSDLRTRGLAPEFEARKLREFDEYSSATLRSIETTANSILAKRTRGERLLGVNNDTLNYLKSQSEYIKKLRRMNELDD